MKEDFDPSLENNNNEDRLVKLEDMFSDSAYYYFDVAEWESMIEYYLSVLKLDKATKALDFAKIQHPSSLELDLKEAELLSEQNKPGNAVRLLQRLEQTYPFDMDIPMAMGSIHSRFGESYKALICFKRALEKADSEDETEIYLHISGECLTLDKPNQAIFWLKQLLVRHPNNIEALYEIAMVYEGEELYSQGIDFFNAFIEVSPYNHHAWFNLGNLYSMEDRLEDALGAYDFSVISFEEFSSGWFNKGSILARLNHFESAIDAFQKTLDLEGPSAPTYCNMAECKEELGKVDEALDLYLLALKHDEQFLDALIGAANCYLELNDLDESFNYCEEGLKISPDHAGLNHVYAEVCQGLSFFKEAKRAYKKVIKLDSKNSEVFLDYSGMLWENGQMNEALEIIESGLVLHKNNAELNYRSGIYWYLTGEKVKAFNRWNNAFIESPLQLEQIFDFCAALKSDSEVIEFFEQF